MSGGQKARIGLARALYSDADIFLLDDPISAVDSRVGNELFNAAISTYLAKKTRILVTHQIQFLNASSIHRIVVMDQGRVASCGTYGELLKNGSLDWIRTIYNKELDSANDVIEEGDENAEDKSVANDDEEGDSNSNRKRSKSSINSESAVDADSIDVTVEALANKAEVEGAANAVEQGITVIEDRQLGTVKISTYSGYVDAIGGLIPLLIITFLLLAGQGLAVSANIWLAKWSRLPYDQQQIQKNMDIFLYLVAGTVAGAFLRAIIIFDFFVRGAEAIQNKMLRSVIRAPILFFDSNPIGRVMNRFSRDIGVLDDLLPSTLFDYCQCLLMCLAAIVVVGIGSPYILLTIVPLSVYFYRLRQHYVRSSREIKRLEAMSRSPIFSHLNETLEGLVTIRGYKKAGDFTHMFRENVNNNTRAFFCFIATSRWLGFRLDIIVALLLVATTFITTGLKESNSGIDSTVLAVGLMYVIQLCGMFQWTVRQSAEVENLMVSVERALAFSKLPSEPALHGPTDMIKYPEWPSKGQIELDHLTCTYRSDLPPVIRDVSVTMTAGQRIGIVGRTGSGKSTLIGALLRLVDITGGQIRIDGLDILQVGLHDLRPKISVIPQTPFLFSETVRKNMDAFSLHSDIEIWAALDSVGLRSVIEKLAASTGREGLDGLVEENGSNFSVGERQLVCLARAILQRNSILIMDEATANVDMETDARVQETIRRQFTQSTVIMIAHRLQTIIDCDKVLVLRNGIVVEYDHPHMLLQKYNNGKYASPQRQVELHDIDAMTNKNVDNDDATESYMKSFAHMVDETGESMSTFLRSQAELAFK